MHIYINKLRKDKTQLTPAQVEPIMVKIRQLLKTLGLPNANVGLREAPKKK